MFRVVIIERKTIASIIIAVIIGTLLNLPSIMPLFEKKGIPVQNKIPLSDILIDDGKIMLDKATKEKIYVPDYSADIFINLLKASYNINELLQFEVIINNKGIQSFQKPYYYVLLLNPDNQIVGIFPNFCSKEGMSFHIGNFEYQFNERTFKLSKEKWPKWTQGYFLNELSQDVHCTDPNAFCINKQCGFLRDYFFENGSQQPKFVFTYDKLVKTGDWQIYVFLFDEIYNVKNKDLNIEKFENNAIASQLIKFNVGGSSNGIINKQRPFTQSFLYLFFVLTITITSYLALSLGLYETIEVLYLKHKKRIDEILILAIALSILLYFLGKVIYKF